MENNRDTFQNWIHPKKEGMLFKFLVLFAFLFIPLVTYTVILNINPSLTYYLDNLDVVRANFGKSVITSKFEVKGLIWLSLALLICGFVLTSCLKLFLKTLSKTSHQFIFYVIIASLAILSIVIEAVSEYYYAKFYSVFEFLAQSENQTLFSDNESVSSMQSVFTEMYTGDNGNRYKYKWSGDTLTWWVAIFKIISVILLFNIWLQSKEEGKKILTRNISRSINKTFFMELFEKFTLRGRKEILIWLIVATSLVFLVPLIYIINISLVGTKMNSMLSWTFVVADLYKNVPEISYFENVNSMANSYFAIKILPIIVSGFLISNILLSSVSYTKNWNKPKKTFIAEFVILLVEILCVISVMTYSVHETRDITNYWIDGTIKASQVALNSTYLEKSYGTWVTNVGFSEPWMSGLKYVSLTIISLSFLVTIYIILGVELKKLK